MSRKKSERLVILAMTYQEESKLARSLEKKEEFKDTRVDVVTMTRTHPPTHPLTHTSSEMYFREKVRQLRSPTRSLIHDDRNAIITPTLASSLHTRDFFGDLSSLGHAPRAAEERETERGEEKAYTNRSRVDEQRGARTSLTGARNNRARVSSD